MTMIKILVTGGAGFIGSNLCEHLLQKGYYVVCLDNFSIGHMSNIQHLINKYPSRFSLVVGDIRDFQTCSKAVQGVDYVFHEAALGSVPRSIENPIATNEVNICGFLNMLVASRDCKVKRFIFAASSSTYGDCAELPKVEERIGKPLSPYALTKYVNELYAELFAKTYGLEFIGLRYFNVFGRRQDPNSMYAAVIPLFIKQFLMHEQPQINGDGSNTRDFTHVDNIIHINMLALETTNPSAINQIYNAAGNERTSINQLASEIRTQLIRYNSDISEIQPIHRANRIGDIPHSFANIDKARHLLGYSPIISFQDGLSATVEWYVNNLQ